MARSGRYFCMDNGEVGVNSGYMSKCIHINCVSKLKLMWFTSFFIHICNESTLYSVFSVGCHT